MVLGIPAAAADCSWEICMQKKKFIDSIRVENPCTESWEEMTGNDRVRFCSHCAKDVNNLSAMSRKDALRLVRRSGGSLCIRYVQHPITKAPVFAEQLTHITRRRVPLMAATVMSASLSLTNFTYAQGGARSPAPNSPASAVVSECVDRPAAADKEKSPGSVVDEGYITGTVMDMQGAVIPGVLISLSDKSGRILRTTRSSDEGTFRFGGLEAGTYSVSAEFASFKTSVIENLGVGGSGETLANISMEVVAGTAIVGDLVVVEEFEGTLAAAVSRNDLEAVRELLARGENVNRKEEDGTTALHIAVENGDIKMIELLLTFGAKVNARTIDKRTPLMEVDLDASAELVQLLIRHGAKVNAVSKNGDTPLIRAARNAESEVVQVLVDAGAPLDVQNENGTTALMEAAESNDLESARILILAGANVNLKDKHGDTAWDKATKPEIEQLLEIHGAIIENGGAEPEFEIRQPLDY